jgi:hypothetical protein
MDILLKKDLDHLVIWYVCSSPKSTLSKAFFGHTRRLKVEGAGKMSCPRRASIKLKFFFGGGGGGGRFWGKIQFKLSNNHPVCFDV